MINIYKIKKFKSFFFTYLIVFFIFFLTGYALKNKIIFFLDDYFLFNNLDQPSNRISRLINNFKIDYQKKNLKKNLIATEKGNFLIKYFPLPDDIGEIRPIGYVSLFNNNLIYASGAGNFFKYKIDTENNLESPVKISNNLFNIIDENNYDEEIFWNTPIRDTLIIDKFLYISAILKKINLDSKDNFTYSSVILRAKLDDDLDFLKFSIYFQTSETIKGVTPDLSHGGGRIVSYKDKKLLFIIPEYGQEELSQNPSSIYGKSILIKINDPYDYEIFTSGHRNSQGLLYDKEKDIIINSEHGPMGGDELNILIKGQNYGWPLTYFGTNGRDVIAKDHSNLNFTKPILIWNDNPGSSQIVKCKDDEYFLSSLTGISGKQIYSFTIKENKAFIKDSIYIDDRVRDLIYLKQKNLLIGVIENSKNIFKINLKNACK
jgi:hypothetical protein